MNKFDLIELEQYAKKMIALNESGDKESIKIFHKINDFYDKNKHYTNGEYWRMCQDGHEEEFAKELGVSTQSLKKAFKLFEKIGLLKKGGETEVEE